MCYILEYYYYDTNVFSRHLPIIPQLAFSPDGKHMYLAYQKNGLLFDVWRSDGLTFSKKHLNIKYHNEETLINR